MTTLKRAKEILNSEKIISARESAKIYNLKLGGHAKIFYNEKTLVHCAKENEQGDNDWRLVYVNALSFEDLINFWGFSNHKYYDEKKGIWKRNDDYLKPSFEGGDNDRYFWDGYLCSETKVKSGYYLLNLEPKFTPRKWSHPYDVQESEIHDLGGKYQRCCELILTQVAFAIYVINKEEVKGNYWGKTVVFDGYSVIEVGPFDKGKWKVSYPSIAFQDTLPSVCLFRKWDK